MKKILPTLLLVLSLSANAAEKGTLKEFAAVRYDRNALVVTSNEISSGYISKVGASVNGDPVAPDSEIDLPLNQVALFYHRHSAITFKPLEKGKGFMVERRVDLRTFRRELTIEQFTITIEPDGTLTYGDVTTTKKRGAEQ